MTWHRRCRRDYTELEDVAWRYLQELCEHRGEAKRLRSDLEAVCADRDDARGGLKRLQERYQLDAWRVESAGRLAADCERLEAENTRLRGELLELEARAGWGGFG